MEIGKSYPRVDAYEKVTGRARYTADMLPGPVYVAKVLHSTVAHGYVRRIHTAKACRVPGVIKVVTCMDAPDRPFPTSGNPWFLQPELQDTADRLLLNRHVRYYGDDIAAVIAEDELAAQKALALMDVEYDEYPAVFTAEQAMAEGAPQLHEGFARNILQQSSEETGDFEAAVREPGLQVFEGHFATQMVQHCHMENPISFANMENGRVVVVASTQIPHILRRIIAQALGLPWGSVRVIKPYIGGGFGNKQEALYEPLNAWLCTLVGGRTVKLELSREECFVSTRTRHPITMDVQTWVRPNGRLVARSFNGWSLQGAYASQGHSVAAYAMGAYRQLYQEEKAHKAHIATVYANLPVGGAMRGYGTPQSMFACESHMEDIANALGLDPLEFRKMNMMKAGYRDPLDEAESYSNGLLACMEKGRLKFGWDEKRAAYQNQRGPVRRGVGMAIFAYKTGVWPFQLETANCRLVLNPDGTVQLQVGATEIGQGSDTVFAQMAAETLGVRFTDIHVVSTQDTDITPFDTGSYASRQAYVSGMAVRKTAGEMKARLLDFASFLYGARAEDLDLCQGDFILKSGGQKVGSMGEVAMEAFYSHKRAVHITAEASVRCESNSFSYGCCFAEVAVDMLLGKVEVLRLLNVHDCGTVLNPKLAEAQVHGGMSMGLGYTLGENMLFDEKTGRPLNGNFLDYKLPTMADTPRLEVEFVETFDPSGPYGNKSLGEPPVLPVAPAIRNAVLHATGVAFYQLPMSPQVLTAKFKECRLI